jgi:hypothetical protein
LDLTPFFPSSAGEPGLSPITPTVASAVFVPTDQRFRQLPVSDGDADNVVDSFDSCYTTAPDTDVNQDDCNAQQIITQRCVAKKFKNYGQYVRCLAHASKDAVDQALMSDNEKHTFIRQGAHAK